MSFRVAGARDCAPCQKWAKSEGFGAFPKTMASVGHLQRICKDAFSCLFRGRRSTRDMFIRDVRRWGRWFPERGCILEFRFAEMILRDRCSTSYDMASLFRGRRSSLDRWTGKIARHIGTRPSALHSTFHTFHFEGSLAELLRFWCCQLRKMRKCRRIASFLTLSSSKIEEVSQKLLRFLCCQLWKMKMKTSRRIAAFLTLSS